MRDLNRPAAQESHGAATVALLVSRDYTVVGWHMPIEDVILDVNREMASQLAIEKPVKVTTVKPEAEPMRVLRDVSEGIEPTFQNRYLRHVKARQGMYQRLADMQKAVDADSQGSVTSDEFGRILDELCEGIGSVATGRDGPRKKRVKPVLRSIDDDWEGG